MPAVFRRHVVGTTRRNVCYCDTGARPEYHVWGLEPRAWFALQRKPITGVWGRSPQRGPGAEPLVRETGGRNPPEAESLLAFQRPIAARKITSFTVSSKLRVCDVSSTFNRMI